MKILTIGLIAFTLIVLAGVGGFVFLQKNQPVELLTQEKLPIQVKVVSVSPTPKMQNSESLDQLEEELENTQVDDTSMNLSSSDFAGL